MPDDHPFPAGLEGLREIRWPEPVSYAPQTVGWWIVFAVLALVVAVAAWRLVGRYRRNAYRREALARLDGLGLRELPVLVKRVALDAFPREDVAVLAGVPWLAFLDRTYEGSGFTEGPGRVLPDLAYGDPTTLSASDEAALRALVRTWIREHRA